MSAGDCYFIIEVVISAACHVGKHSRKALPAPRNRAHTERRGVYHLYYLNNRLYLHYGTNRELTPTPTNNPHAPEHTHHTPQDASCSHPHTPTVTRSGSRPLPHDNSERLWSRATRYNSPHPSNTHTQSGAAPAAEDTRFSARADVC